MILNTRSQYSLCSFPSNLASIRPRVLEIQWKRNTFGYKYIIRKEKCQKAIQIIRTFRSLQPNTKHRSLLRRTNFPAKNMSTLIRIPTSSCNNPCCKCAFSFFHLDAWSNVWNRISVVFCKLWDNPEWVNTKKQEYDWFGRRPQQWFLKKVKNRC